MLLKFSLDNAPPEAPVLPAPTWTRRRINLPTGRWLLATITPGPDWSDLDEVVSKLPGRRGIDSTLPQLWHALPWEHLDTIRTLFAGQPNRLILRERVQK